MKKIIPTLTLTLFFVLASTALAQMSLKDGQIQYKENGADRSLALEEGAVTEVRNSDLVFVSLADSDFLRAVKKEAGLFFFDQGGNFKGAYAGREGFDPEMCAAASLSPGGRTIALDNGAWLVRIWTFLKYPDFVSLGPADDPFVSYLSDEKNAGNDLAWVDDSTVIFTDISEAAVSRPCPSDPCEPLDVVVHFIEPWKSVAVAKGTELCDYRFKSLAGRSATVDKICTKKIEDWGNIDDFKSVGTVTQEVVKIPAQP